jgi:hypothetical protein
MWNFVWGNRSKAQLALFPQTKFHIQKCDTCRSIEKPSRGICFLTMVQHSLCISTRVYTPTYSYDIHTVWCTVRVYTMCPPCVHRRSGALAGTATKLPQLTHELTDSYRFIYKISEWRVVGVLQHLHYSMPIHHTSTLQRSRARRKKHRRQRSRESCEPAVDRST